ncbi:MAG: response regulator [Polyangiaceae bacterium]|nr:response regulator [Polyangiaceae bacterium]
MSADTTGGNDALVAELAEARQQLHSVIGAMPIVLWAVDVDGVITLSEGQALMSLGLSPGQLVGRSVYEVYAASPEAVDAIRRAMRGEAQAGEVEVGGRTWSNRYFPRRGAAGEILGLTGLSIDVTASKALEREARRLEEQVQQAQKLESLGLMAGGIAHDFNNLLAAILGSFNLLAREVPAASRARALVAEGERATLRAADLTHQMLAYAGRGQFRLRPADLNSLVVDMGSLIASGISKHATVSYELADGLPPVTVDPAQIQQVVMNLLTNASDALGGHPGEIHVATGRTSEHPAPVGVRHGVVPLGDSVFFEVSDSGAGMDEPTQRRIFEPFFSTKETGRGLGLAAVLGIVRRHHGSLELQSAPHAGTTFRVTLPVTNARAVVPPTGPAREAGGEATHGGRVLLVDDEDMVRSVVGQALRDAGYEVDEYASSPLAASRAVRHAREYAVAVLDLVMPGLTGHELSRLLRAEAPALPVVLMSGFVDDRGARAGELERTAFLHKPFLLTALLDELARLRASAP